MLCLGRHEMRGGLGGGQVVEGFGVDDLKDGEEEQQSAQLHSKIFQIKSITFVV